MSFLSGKKTYLMAIAIGIVVALKQAGIITDEIANSILALLGAGGLAALRAGVAKK